MRQEVINWWNSLDPLEQRGHFLEYQELHFTPARTMSELTGREVEIIYNSIKELN